MKKKSARKSSGHKSRAAVHRYHAHHVHHAHHKHSVWQEPVNPFLAWTIIAFLAMVGMFALNPTVFGFQ